ncbi:hypothetical protein HNV12_15685 [Methanococcoides sp. SA1]|nr:hypothetical protein [Methanococcoides sp. SA1]
MDIISFYPGFGTQHLIAAILLYAYFSYSLQVIAAKTQIGNSWMAWIPILNLILMCRIGNTSIIVLLGLLIPLLNLFIFAYIWGEIAFATNRSRWYGLLTIVPGINVLLPGYLAFTN